MSQSSAPSLAIDDILRCFICLNRVVDAQLCPSCSKLCCSACILKWLTENRYNCPHCRSPLHPDTLVSGRFVSEIAHALDKLQVLEATDKCEAHGAAVKYLCATCEEAICSDCAMFEAKHKGHEFKRISEVYEKSVQEIKKEAESLKTKLGEFTSVLTKIEGNLEEIQKSRSAKIQEISARLEQLQKNLDDTLRDKIGKLIEAKTNITDEIDRLESIHKELVRALAGPKGKLIAKTPELLHQLKTATEQPLTSFQFVEMPIEFPNELEPPYESAMYVLRDFSQIRRKTEVVYSEQLHTHGLSWRLKVYPNGNGLSKGSHLSVFLEMVKGGNESAKYSYKVELMNSREAGKSIVREFASEFETGECWGYNRFMTLDTIESMGYLDTDQLTFRFSIRPATYSQLIEDQRKYISLLEAEQRGLMKETEELQERLQNYEKPLLLLQSHENPLSSLVDPEEEKSPRSPPGVWQEEKSEKDEGRVRLAGLSLMKKFMQTPEEGSLASSSPAEGSQSSDDCECALRTSQELIIRSGEVSDSHENWMGQNTAEEIESPRRSL